MRFILVADTFPPLRTSGAVQLRDLSREFIRQGHDLTVALPSADIAESWRMEEVDGVCVLRLKSPKTKDIGYVRRTIGEFIMPFAMLRNYRKCPLASVKWDGVIWYSPSIFHGPFVNALKRKSSCPGYLIIRDIFPEWAVDMGLMGRGLPYRFFNAVARYQYSVANVIGVQTPGNLAYFNQWSEGDGRQLEVLQNWLGPMSSRRCSIRVDQTSLAGRRIFVYAGNMGVAQGMDILLELADRLRALHDVGFIFVGRGSEAKRLADAAMERKLENVLFFDEIDPDEVPDLYAQCHFGLVALDPRHKSHNIPGKFLTYMQSGLPVLANINAGNDLAEIIRNENVGRVCDDNSIDALLDHSLELISLVNSDVELSNRCKSLFSYKFSVESTVRQIVASFTRDKW